MARSALAVREARLEDIPALVALFDELREHDPRWQRSGRATSDHQRQAAAQRYEAALDDPDQRVVVVCAGAEPVGMALLSVGEATTLVPTPTVHMSHVSVARRHRRRGAGRALVAAAAAWAEERGVDSVSIGVFPGARDAHRYYARLGFSPLVVRRVASVATLRRRLCPDTASVTSLGDALQSARRRRTRDVGESDRTIA